MQIRTFANVALFASLAAPAAASAAETLFTQSPPITGSAASISVSTGGNVFGFANRRAADNFILPFPATLQHVTFWGGAESSEAVPQLANFAGWKIAIFTPDLLGNPSTAIYTQDFLAVDITPTPLPGTVGLLGAILHRFTANLGTPLSLDGSTPYFLSVSANLVNPVGFDDEAFQWAAASSPDTTIWQDRYDGSGFLPRTLTRRNAAFTLSGTIIPEPASLAMLVALIPLTTRRQRR